MVKDPIEILMSLNLENVKYVTVHDKYREVGDYLRGGGSNRAGPIMVGKAISPNEQIGNEDYDYVLIMTVEPGRGGQKMKKDCLGKFKEAKSRGLRTGIDGGVTVDNVSLFKDADYIVVGSAVTQAEDREATLNEIFLRTK